jgi:hypothetical protein
MFNPCTAHHLKTMKRILSSLALVAPLLVTSNGIATAIEDKVVLPNYVAVDYDIPGRHPSLTPAQVTRIRQTLAQVKPCQRRLVHYAIPAKDGIALFFWPPDDEASLTHVFGMPGIVYRPEMGLFPGPPDRDAMVAAQAKQGIQWDIDHQLCPK